MAFCYEFDDAMYIELSSGEITRWRANEYPFKQEILDTVKREGRLKGKKRFAVKGAGDLFMGDGHGPIAKEGE
jgi:hypothetical protein